MIAPARRPFSYARIASALLPRIGKHLAVHHFAYDTETAESASGWDVHANPGATTDPFGIAALPRLLERIDPHAVLVINDLALYRMHKHTLDAVRSNMRVLLYCPIDGDRLVTGRSLAFRDLDCLVVFADFAKQAVVGDWSGVRREPPTFRIEVIPHGVDLKTFHPLGPDGGAGSESRTTARHALLPDRPDLADAFIVLNANQNNGRKRLDLTLSGFSAFAKEAPRPAYLWLHCNIHAASSKPLRPMMRDLGILDRVIVPDWSPQGPFLSDTDLNLVYNACDIGLNTSTGEGWGLVAFEHGATGAGQIVPDHSAPGALWRAAGRLLSTDALPPRSSDLTEARATTAEAVTEALHEVAADPAVQTEYGRRAIHLCRQPEFDWDEIAGRWCALIDSVLD
jgi:D-inositol-3-phosphate glycosyltransferase